MRLDSATHLKAYEGKNLKHVLHDADAYGVDFRTPLNLIPLMCAAIQGNAGLVQALLDKGADPELADTHGRTALHLALLRAYADPRFGAERLPASVSVKVQDRLVQIDGHTSEFFLFHSMIALLLRKIGEPEYFVPASVLPTSWTRCGHSRRTWCPRTASGAGT